MKHEAQSDALKRRDMSLCDNKSAMPASAETILIPHNADRVTDARLLQACL